MPRYPVPLAPAGRFCAALGCAFVVGVGFLALVAWITGTAL